MDDDLTDAATYESPALSAGKVAYLSSGLDAVQGWLIPSTALYLAGLEQAQRGEVDGGLCEIGVHRGKSFLAMAIDAPGSDPAVAIDVFDLQHLNEDGTSNRALEDFRDNLRAWGLDQQVEIVQGSSLELEADGFLDAGPRFRLFSVDGGHGADYVLNDLRIAEATLAPGGVVAADDVFNIHWLGVCTGVFRYFHAGGALVPFALIPNKLLLTDAASVEANRDRLRALFGAGLTKTDVPMLDGVIDVYGDVPWELVDDVGNRAALQRPDDSIDAVRTELTGAQLELAKLRTKLREVQEDKRTLQRRLRRVRVARSATQLASAQPLSRLGRRTRALLQGGAKKGLRTDFALDPDQVPGTTNEVARLRAKVRALRERNRRFREQIAQLKARAGETTTAVAEIPGRTRLQVRRDCVFASSSPAASVLEIGPAHNAILPKREGFATRTVDYLDRAGLIEAYRAFEHYSPDDIEEVDYVLAPGSAMADVIPERFDVVLASHVIEHTTSMIDFLNECTRLLAPGGVVALVVPDHRFCLDRFRERSSLSRVIDASLAPPPVHTVGTVTEAQLNAVRRVSSTSWRPGSAGRFGFVHDRATVESLANEARRAERYLDVHNWVCSPHHLRLLLHDLADLGYVSVRETFFHDTVGHEFFLNLSVDGPGPGLSRAELVTLADEERRSSGRARFREDDSVPEAPLPAGRDGDLH